MNQVVIGASIPFVVAVFVYVLRRFRATFGMLALTPLFMALGALWAVVPDVPRLLGDRALYDKLDRDPRCDIFFWHHTIDRMETDSPVFAALFVLMACALLSAAMRELAMAESGVSECAPCAGE